MTNPTDQLTALHELAKSCPGGVDALSYAMSEHKSPPPA